MKQVLHVVLTIMIATALSCSRGDKDGTPTEIGTPVGGAVIATIDADGGTLSSVDGLLEVIVPPGAVSSATDFEIQEITNKCFGGLGGAFVISPADVVFNESITLVFYYGNVLDESIDFSTLRVALQNDRQIWMAFKDREVDSVAQTVSIKTNSFSPFAGTGSGQVLAASTRPGTSISLLRDMRINPENSDIKLGESKRLILEVNCRDCYEYSESDGEQLAPLHNWLISDFPGTEWEILEGPGDLQQSDNMGLRWDANYFSPETLLPGERGKVRIKATTTVRRLTKTYTGVAYASINIETPYFRFKMIVELDPNRPPLCANDQSYKDQAYFTFEVLDQEVVMYEEIENFDPRIGNVTSFLPGCTVQVADLGNLIDLDGMAGTASKIRVNGKIQTHITLNGFGTTTEATYFISCPGIGGYYCPPEEVSYPVNYGMSFIAEDPSTYVAYGGNGFRYEILNLNP